MLKPAKYILYTICCNGAIYRVGKVNHCQSCKKPAQYRRKATKYATKHTAKTIVKNQQFPTYKPVKFMSISDREDEAIKRRQIIAEYGAIKPADTTEIKFIKQRIKWNNDRIALLLG